MSTELTAEEREALVERFGYRAYAVEQSAEHGPDWSDSLPSEPPSCDCGYNGTPEECAAFRQEPSAA